jgi:hypothetical protein
MEGELGIIEIRSDIRTARFNLYKAFVQSILLLNINTYLY